jgi:hypothetical protein
LEGGGEAGELNGVMTVLSLNSFLPLRPKAGLHFVGESHIGENVQIAQPKAKGTGEKFPIEKVPVNFGDQHRIPLDRVVESNKYTGERIKDVLRNCEEFVNFLGGFFGEFTESLQVVFHPLGGPGLFPGVERFQNVREKLFEFGFEVVADEFREIADPLDNFEHLPMARGPVLMSQPPERPVELAALVFQVAVLGHERNDELGALIFFHVDHEGEKTLLFFPGMALKLVFKGFDLLGEQGQSLRLFLRGHPEKLRQPLNGDQAGQQGLPVFFQG